MKVIGAAGERLLSLESTVGLSPAEKEAAQTTGEVAILLEVQDALLGERYAEASSLLRDFGALIQQIDHRRELLLGEVALLEREGRFAEAIETFESFKALGPSTDDIADYSIVEQALHEGLEGVHSPRVAKEDIGPVAQRGTDLPTEFELGQTYPNPFNPRATVPFSLSARGSVRIEAVDVVGRRVAVLVDGKFESGRHHVTFDAGNLASGIYLIRADWASNGQSGSQARVVSLIK